jgi:nucleoside-diphosphate-sugar epimerase
MNRRIAGRILVLGATGYVGNAVLAHLLEAGEEVVALLRPGAAAALPSAVVTRHGDLTDPDSLRAAVTDDVAAVVHLAPPTGNEAVDSAALEALIEALAPSRGALVYTSGAWVLGRTDGRAADEESDPDPLELVHYRPRLEAQVTAAAGRGVRSVVIRPGVVHGRGGGIPAMLVALAGQHGSGLHIGTGVRWSMVDVDDLADLYVLALHRADAGQILHGVAEQGVDTRELARAAAAAANVSGVREWPLDQARADLGREFADALACDQLISAATTMALLDWRPRRPGAVADLAEGSYRALVSAD